MVLAAPSRPGLTSLLAVAAVVAVPDSLALAQADERGAQAGRGGSGSVVSVVSSISAVSGTSSGVGSIGSVGTSSGGVAMSINTTASTTATAVSATTPSLCEARTINYITHSLPQSCLTSPWTSPWPSPTGPSPTGPSPTGPSPSPAEPETAPPAAHTLAEPASAHQAAPDATPTTFMSFEDWKEMMLRRAGQDPQELRSRKPSHAHDRQLPDMGHAAVAAGLGEEGEISLNFDHYSRSHDAPDDGPSDDDALAYSPADSAAAMRRSKDAGKTCKERFSYSSFDAGATILKAAAGAKNPRAILVENKDTYMLLECAAPHKYVVVELSDDILVDTVVIANFEFFSSMIRHFRVSVSDRYPVKMDKWRELATFEARNSRDIQPFLVQNPQIWAKYVRIDFLTHYGNEYYCPVSLLRVHGSRMLDSWKDSETGRDDDLQIEANDASAMPTQGQAAPPLPAPSPPSHDPRPPQDVTPWEPRSALNPFEDWPTTCPGPGSWSSTATAGAGALSTTENAVAGATMGTPAPDQESDSLPSSGGAVLRQMPPSAEGPSGQAAPTAKPAKPDPNKVSSAGPFTAPSDPAVASPADGQTAGANATGVFGASSSNETVGERGHHSGAAANGKPRSSGSPGAPAAAPPTVQEGGFFNAMAKRLQQVESNLTLSLKYVEEQSRHVHEALHRGEQKQQARVALFLSDLNQTVFAELRNIRDQYDQIWQSTVLALESQAERSERDMMALSTRLNLLADEVVFQKRMAIVQAVILLSCLFLVIFSRGVGIPSLSPSSDQPSSPTRPVQRDGAAASYDSLPPGHHVRHDREPSPPEYQRLSPPLTPGLHVDPCSSAASQTPLAGRDAHGDSDVKPSRRPPCLSHVNSRKPLPSLPEHPSPPHEA